jgi:hypothetical protein
VVAKPNGGPNEDGGLQGAPPTKPEN